MASVCNEDRTPQQEFVEQDVYIDDEPKLSAALNAKIDINFNTTSESSGPLLGTNNTFVKEDSSPKEEEVISRCPPRSPARSLSTSSNAAVRTKRVSSSGDSSKGNRLKFCTHFNNFLI